MNQNFIKTLKKARNKYQKIFPAKNNFGVSYANAAFQQQEASDLIKEKLLDKKPAMVCRFGSVELNCVLNYCFIHQNKTLLSKSTSYLTGKTKAFWWEAETIETMCNNAGFFPKSTPLLEKFSELMLEDMKQVDVLGSWLLEESFIDSYMPNAVKVRLPDLEPYYHQNPWTEALAGKTVLVIHPYEASILAQYKKRNFLFENKKILPDFNLKTIKAVQSIANNKTEFSNWFDALHSMFEKIEKTDFDIAIIGCGAYGFSLAAHVKRLGKKAVHLGGATQLLFGIKGKRWEDHDYISKLMNENWIKPLPIEYPANFTKVEDGCYW